MRKEILFHEPISIAQIARRRILDELSEVEPSIVDSANKLGATGIVNKHVRFLSPDKLAGIVSIIKGTDDGDENGGIPAFLKKLNVLRKPPSFLVFVENAIEASFRRSDEDLESEENQALGKSDSSPSPKSAETAVNRLVAREER